MSNRFMNNMASIDAASTARDARAGAPRDLADLIRHAARSSGRHGYRVKAPGATGHIFFDAGRVVHAEFGEDCGLRAVNEMLRSGAVALEPASNSWPAQATLHLSPELLLALTERDTSRVVRKVDLPVEPPPLPGSVGDEPGTLVAPVHPAAARPSAPKRPVSGIMPRMGGSASVPTALATVPRHAASAAPIVRAREPRTRSTIAAAASRTSAALAAAAPPPSISPVPPRASSQPTTMVRITPHGELLAARGKNAEQVAEAAAFIHGLATAIAADFGRRARANVHLSGNGMSLLVARSEVNDIAAALGTTDRVSALLGKVGFK